MGVLSNNNVVSTQEKKMDKQQLSNVCFTASLASVLVSIATWVLISPEDPAHGERFALFIGLWAPTHLWASLTTTRNRRENERN